MSKTILLADDSVTIQKVVGLTIANQDYKLVAVSDGDEAVQKAAEINPDICIADAVMPKKDGYEVCRALKGNPATSSIPVIILAGTFEPYDENKGKEVGVDSVIVKPFESQAFLETVGKVIASGATAVAGGAPAPAEAAVVAEPVMAEAVPVAAEAVKEPEVSDFDFSDLNAEQPEVVTAEPVSEPVTAEPIMAESVMAEPEEVSFADVDIPSSTEVVVPDKQPIVEEPAMEMSLDSFGEDIPVAEEPSEPIAVEPVSIPDAKPGEPAIIEPAVQGNVAAKEEVSSDDSGVSMPDATPLSPDQLTVGPKAAQAVVAAAGDQLKGVDRATIEKITREEIQKVIWDIIPELAEAIIREEINKLLRQQSGA